MALAASFDPATYNKSTPNEFKLGAVYSNGDGNLYTFVHVNTADCADGAVMCWYSTGDAEVIGANRTTALVGTPAAAMFAGLGKGVITAGNYGFIQVWGIHKNVLSGTSTLGMWQCPIATNDSCGNATASMARTESIFGRCLVATSAGRCTVRLGYA